MTNNGISDTPTLILFSGEVKKQSDKIKTRKFILIILSKKFLSGGKERGGVGSREVRAQG